MVDNYFYPFLFALLLISGSLVLGTIWNRLAKAIFKQTQATDTFWLYFTGLFTGISLFAIVMTKGVTLLLLCPVFLLVLQPYLPAAGTNKDRSADLLFLFLAASVQYLLFVYLFLPSADSVVRYVGGDFNIYFRAAEHISRSGVESYNFSVHTEGYTLPTLYHFGDIWMYALAARINRLQPTATFLTAFTVLGPLFSVGLLAYIRQLFPARSGKALYYFLILAGSFSAFAFCMPAFIARIAEPYTLAVFNWGKVMVLSCCMIGVLILIKLEKLKAALFVIVITGLLYINAFPAFFGAYTLLCILFLWQRKEKFSTVATNLLLLVLLIVFPVLLQYKILPGLLHLQDNAAPIQSMSPLARLSMGKYLKTALNIFIGGWFQFFTIIPYLILLVLGLWASARLKNAKLKTVLAAPDASFYFLFFLFLAGLAGWAVSFPLQIDTVQFFHNILAPVYCIFISIVLYYLLLVVKKPALSVSIIGVTLFSVVLSSAHPFFVSECSRKDWEKLTAFLKDDKDGAGKFISSDTKVRLSNAFFRKSDQYVPLNILVYRFPEYQNASLVSPFLSLDSGSFYLHEAANDLQTSSLGRYLMQCKSNDTVANILSFVGRHNFSYYSVSRDTACADFLRPFLGDSCVLESTNIVVYRLNRNFDHE
jgi:hypothetical protein